MDLLQCPRGTAPHFADDAMDRGTGSAIGPAEDVPADGILVGAEIATPRAGARWRRSVRAI